MADRRRSISNPLALAVLACLHERPMHPYEMAATMRERGKEQSIKLNYGSLYTVVDSLAKHGLIAAMAARREGRRPERTVYQLTEAGRARLETELSWVRELADELEAGTLEGLDGWRHVYETGEAPTWDLDVAALEKLREVAAEGGTPPG